MKTLLYCCIASTVVLCPLSAFAHTHLVRAVPADKSVVEKSPPMATLVFAEAVTLTAIKIKPAAGAEIDLKPLPTGPTADVSVAVPELKSGNYEMRWRALSDDGHVMSGVVHFSVGSKGGR